MANRVLFAIVFLTSIAFSETVKMQGISVFETWQDSTSPCSDKTMYHRKWNNYIPISNSLNQTSIIDELFDETWSIGSPNGEGFKMNITVTKWDDTGKGYNKMSWQFNTTGSAAEVVKDFLKITQYGCCDVRTRYSYYSIKTGKFIFQCYSDIYDATNEKKRYFGYIPMILADLKDKPKDIKNYQGIGYLFSDTSIISKIYIKTNRDEKWFPSFSGNSLQLGLNFSKGKIIHIKIVNDSLMILK